MHVPRECAVEAKLRYRPMFIGASPLIQRSKSARVGKAECCRLQAMLYLRWINSLSATCRVLSHPKNAFIYQMQAASSLLLPRLILMKLGRNCSQCDLAEYMISNAEMSA